MCVCITEFVYSNFQSLLIGGAVRCGEGGGVLFCGEISALSLCIHARENLPLLFGAAAAAAKTVTLPCRIISQSFRFVMPSSPQASRSVYEGIYDAHT